VADVYKRAQGRRAGQKVTKVIAVTSEAQDAVTHAARQLAERASAVLSAQRHSGDAFIEVEKGKVDRYVVLNDTRGQSAAMTIEFGRQGGTTDRYGRPVSPMDPVAPLRLAASMPIHGLQPSGKKKRKRKKKRR